MDLIWKDIQVFELNFIVIGFTKSVIMLNVID